MTRIRSAAARVAGAFRAALTVLGLVLSAVLVPESDEEAVVLVGLALLAAGFIAIGMAPLALLVPGALYVAIGLGFSLRR